VSTKIHTGFRVQLEDLYPALDLLRKRMWKKIVKLAREAGVHDWETNLAFVKEYADAGFHVLIDQGNQNAYIIPWGFHRFRDVDGKLPSWIKDYCYWNNTDTMPDGVTKKQWRERSKDWSRVLKHWNHRLISPVWDKEVLGGYQLHDHMEGKKKRKQNEDSQAGQS
jgi:hypothetical protein